MGGIDAYGKKQPFAGNRNALFRYCRKTSVLISCVEEKRNFDSTPNTFYLIRNQFKKDSSS